MNRAQGQHFTSVELDRILHFLKNSDLSMSVIAIRMHCSRSAINSVNRKFQVRAYDGKRNRWAVLPQDSAQAS